MEKEAQPDKGKPGKHRVYDHCLQIEFQCLLSLGANADHADADQLYHLTPGHGVEHLETSE